ncbi:MAG: RNA pseudouridine synthase, partial [Pseudophaeobacter sp.]
SLPPAAIAAVQSFPRQALHAAVLGFVHPVSGAEMRFEAPLPQDMSDLIEALRLPPVAG